MNAEDLAKDAGVKALLGKLHEVGASQKVVDVAIGELVQRGIAIREAQPLLDEAACVAELRTSWKGEGEATANDATYKQQIGRAFAAAKAYAGADLDGILKDHGNDPRIVRMLARVGAELSEDTQPSPEAQQQLQSNLDTLMANPAYLDDRHAQHASIVAQVSALTAKMTSANPAKQNNTMSFNPLG